MGIQGLLPQLKDITNRVHIREFAGKRAAIDGYGWLYKGAYSCPRELCEDVPTDKCVSGLLQRLLLQRCQIIGHHSMAAFCTWHNCHLIGNLCTLAHTPAALLCTAQATCMCITPFK
jgi:XPG N-terminal domain